MSRRCRGKKNRTFVFPNRIAISNQLTQKRHHLNRGSCLACVFLATGLYWVFFFFVSSPFFLTLFCSFYSFSLIFFLYFSFSTPFVCLLCCCNSTLLPSCYLCVSFNCFFNVVLIELIIYFLRFRADRLSVGSFQPKNKSALLQTPTS